MTAQLALFDCPYGGCEDGYCPCSEDYDPEDLEPEDLELLEALEDGAELIYVRGHLRVVETVPIPIDHYEPPEDP